MSRPYAEVIGDPISHSKSPLIHNFWLEKLGIEAEYRACHVRPDELKGYFARRREDANWRGCNVTIPHKEKVGRWLDHLRADTAKIGAVNTIFRHPDSGLTGTNTDIDGVREALEGVDFTGRAVVVIGAGGAARAAFAFLEGTGCGEVRVLVRSPDRAKHALEDFMLPASVIPFDRGGMAFDAAAVVINATQLGMNGQPEMPGFVIEGLSRTAGDAHVFDMVYAPLRTQLLAEAAELGRTNSHGLVMLVGQARTAFARFFGKSPDPAWDSDLFALLTQ